MLLSLIIINLNVYAPNLTILVLVLDEGISYLP